MGDEKLDKNGLIKVWLKIWTLIKLIVGDVDIVDKGDLQTQINNMGKRVSECFQSASDGKNLLADAITGKGVPTEANDTFATMAENISNIKEADDSINEESPNYRTGYNAGVAATKKRYSRDRGRADRKDLYQCQQCRGSRSDGKQRGSDG